jgi:hypothetical protein
MGGNPAGGVEDRLSLADAAITTRFRGQKGRLRPPFSFLHTWASVNIMAYYIAR